VAESVEVGALAQWDAFISYARSASTLEAQRLQTAIQTFAKPWYRLRAVRIFRDDSSMSASPALWSSIEQGLRQARWLVVLLSPAAARSEYVAAEIRWWLANKDSATILLVHDEGVLAWDRSRNDFSADSDCIPAPLRGAFREEPRWTDLSWFDLPGSSGPADPRFTEKVADLAATIRGIPRDELLGEDVVQFKRSWRLAKVAIGLLSLLLIASIVAGIVAVAQRNEVVRQANTLLARQLAVTSESLLARDLRRAQLMAVQAWRTDPTPATRAALLRANLASPALRRFVPFAARINAVSSSADGRFVAIGLDSGEVFSWDVATGSPVARFRLPAQVDDVGISNEGTVVAAVDGTNTYVSSGSSVGSLVLPAGQAPQFVAVNPSGTGVLIASKGDAPQATIVELDKRSQRTVPDPISPDGYGASSVRFVGDDTVVLSSGATETRTFPGFVRITRGDTSYGARQLPGRMSSDGKFATATNGTSEVPVWPINGDQDNPPRYAFVPMTNETASALNHDGTLLAVADASGVHVAQVRETRAPAGFGHSATPPRSFVGVSQVKSDGLLFLGTSARFVAVAGSELSLWDPSSAGRSATTAEVAVPFACTACGSPTVVVSPDGGSMAIRDGFRDGLLVGNVPGNSGGLLASAEFPDPVGELAPPVWLDNKTVLQVTPGDAGGTLRGALPNLPNGVVGWAVGHPETRVLALKVAADGQSVLVVDADGRLIRYHPRTGVLISQSQVSVEPRSLFDAAISDDLATVALVQQEIAELLVVDAATGAERFRIGSQSENVVRAMFASGSLWVRYPTGLVERRDPSTGTLQRRLPGRFPGSWSLSESAGIVAIPTDLDIALYDAAGDAVLGTVGVPSDWAALRRGIDLSPDGSALVSVFESGGNEGDAGLALSTDLEPEDLVGLACRTAGGSLTAEDWQGLVGSDVPNDLACR